MKMDININSFRNRSNTHPLGSLPQQSILRFFLDEEKKFMKRRTKIEALKKEVLHLEMQPPIILAQIISLMPIHGVTGADPSGLKFRWRSLKVLYCLLIFSFDFILLCLTMHNYTRKTVDYRSLGDLLFYTGTMFSSMYFLNFARNWKEFVYEWTLIQDTMSDLETCSVRTRIKIVTAWLALSSVFEHLLSNSETFLNFGDSKEDRFKMFIQTRHMQVFEVFDYSPIFGICVYLTNFIITMIWNYIDIFLTTISLSLAKMFKQLSYDIEKTSHDVTIETAESYWRKRREIYSRLSLLSKSVNDKLSLLIVVSFCLNLYFICVQLLQTIRPVISLSNLIYFAASFGHLLCRTCAVCFAAASLYENSKEPLKVVFGVPTEYFNIEVQRLQTQIASDTIALTGCNFFTVTRSLMLTIAGTIVTYEIVLYQFNVLNVDNSNQGTNNVGNSSG